MSELSAMLGGLLNGTTALGSPTPVGDPNHLICHWHPSGVSKASVHISPRKVTQRENNLHFTKELTLGKRVWMGKGAVRGEGRSEATLAT